MSKNEETDLNKMIARTERAREAMEKGRDTPNFPRLYLEWQVAGLQYSLASLDQRFQDAHEKRGDAMAESAKWREIAENALTMLNELPGRVLALEQSHGFLTMRSMQSSFVKDVVNAYELGKKGKPA